MYKPLDSKPNFPELEKEIQAFWEQDKTFQKSIANREGAETFVFFEGPPTANAAPALHHIPSRAFKDAMGRFQTMRGKKVLRKAGWDTHGLPVELQIEKKLGISGKKQIENIVPGDRFASIAEFNKQSKESVWQFKEEWEKLTGRMAYWVDLSDPYVTYDSKYIESVWWILAQLWQKNLVYQGHKVIPYCPRCGTALSSHEVAQGYAEVKDTSVFVKFKLKDQSDTYILSWTTTPWTLPGNVALALGEDIEYAKVKVGAENWILAKERLSTLQESFEEIETLKGSDLVGLSYEPIFPGAIPDDKLNEAAFKVYAADFVTTGDGTGVVHTAVMYGEDDYELGNIVGLPKYHTVDETGRFLESVPVVGGMVVKHKDKPTENETTTKILDYLKENNLLVRFEEHSHTYPFCWRCGTPLLYYARQSWYIKMSE
ncbi:MAG TPA: class I tRNA ligase family protein, partial [Flavobacterium sp.]|nr:class I tRNA ligase family protein [Flavobacterium sp.]